MISAIVAVDVNWGIGYKGQLLERIPDDLKYFKQLTEDNIVIMGKNTWDSLPFKPLPNRVNIVLSRSITPCATFYNSTNTSTYFTNQIPWEKFQTYKEVFVIGGGSIYEQLLPFCDRIYVTKIYKEHGNLVDTYFPNLDENEAWSATPISPIREYEGLTYQFWQYDRI